ncbi:SMI1/KNR4 family protein [Denitrobaculum tricleocarpae]|uniref:SMI1/KNR4 family protein n=1 Tax=Denitrobaculum tricleocarpae TaxID=2591009 RepID=A0A545TU94_9PROT|nr:SMI1/KNR4 family protein [Denitrobaculum tricleocarpae]TQV80788.1 SMI1/KNR4 family protein [Denitrobaculum tricleocarpae]
MTELVNRGPHLTKERLAEFETSNGIRLPSDYREFLLTYNGGRPVPDTFPLVGHKESESGVSFLYGIDYPIESLELQWMFDLNDGYFSDPAFKNFFQIGNDGFNDKICLDLSDERFGAVIFIDMVPMWKDHTEKDIYVIAGSFTEFLEMLYEPEDDD